MIAVYFLGYYMRGLVKEIEQLKEVVKSKVDKQPEIQEPESMIIDLTDPVQEAIWEHKKLMEKMNGK